MGGTSWQRGLPVSLGSAYYINNSKGTECFDENSTLHVQNLPHHSFSTSPLGHPACSLLPFSLSFAARSLVSRWFYIILQRSRPSKSPALGFLSKYPEDQRYLCPFLVHNSHRPSHRRTFFRDLFRTAWWFSPSMESRGKLRLAEAEGDETSQGGGSDEYCSRKLLGKVRNSILGSKLQIV